MRAQTTILIVDDNQAMAETMADILSMKGYAAHLAFSGVEALQILKREQIHILLTDVVMPDMDGVTLARVAQNVEPGLIVFLMTAYADAEILQQGMAEGVKTVLSKPVNINLLLDLLKAAG